MVLSDNAVKELIDQRLIEINPQPAEKAWQAMTLEGHLSTRIGRIKWRREGGVRNAIDLAEYKTREFAEQFWEQCEISPENYVPIHPGEFLLAYTEEKLALHSESRVCALVEGKSGLARIGLGIHLAPIIHCGFGSDQDGPQSIMLEMYNHSKNIILLRPGHSICQFMFLKIEGEMGSKGAKDLGRAQPDIKRAV